MYFNNALNFFMTMSSADNPFKQFGSKLMYFNNALNFFMTMSSADNHFKQFGPRSGWTFCQDLIGVQIVRHFRGYDKLKLNLNMLLSSADNPFK